MIPLPLCFSKSIVSRAFVAFSAATIALSLSGCALEDNAGPVQVPIAGMKGVVHGGPNPIIGAKVTLWETGTGAYGSQNATALATATTVATGGSFKFTGTYTGFTCTSNQYLYITAVGGNTGSNAVNNNSIQMAALGPCTKFAADTTSATDANISISVSEVSTVAAGYALSNFTTVTGALGSQNVYVTAPANNSAASGACTVTNNYISSCTAAGIAHAFGNATNLVDAVRFDGTTPTGAALAVPASNSSGVAPQAFINSIANSLQACTNSGGVAGSGTSCSNLFTYTTLTGTSNSTNGRVSTPTDELTAVINMAKAPTSNATNIYNLGTGNTTFFLPDLTAAPTDLSLAIFYPVSNSSATAVFPISVALDANDNAYVLSTDVQAGGAVIAGSSGLSGYGANGSLAFATAMNNNYCYPTNIVADGNGNVWFPNHESSTTTCPGNATAGATAGIYGYSTAGTPNINSPTLTIGETLSGTSPYNIAIDRHNDVWIARSSSSSNSFYEFAPPYTVKANLPPPAITPVYGISIDANQNIWIASNNTSATANVIVLPNQGLITAPGYGSSSLDNYKTTASAPVALSGSSATSGAGTIAFDGGGNAWVATSTVLSKVAPSYTTATTPISLVSYKCSTCTLMTFTTASQATPFTSGNYVYVSGGSTAFSNYLYLISSTAPTSTTFTSTLCNVSGAAAPCTAANVTTCTTAAPCTPVASTADTADTAYTPAVASSFSSATSLSIAPTAPFGVASDGVGAFWTNSNSSTGTVAFALPASSVSQSINPCYLPGAATTCQSGTSFGGAIAVDSTGSVWTTSQGSQTLVQIIGSAAPQWPLTAYGQPATMPQ